MAALKYSRQRESIKEFLNSTKEHPTADMVYTHVRKDFPNISLGTVYRNLNLLADIGEATKITTSDGGDRFDGRTEPHYHFYCSECNRLFDLDIDTMDHINELAEKNFDGKIEKHNIVFYGKCGECLKHAAEQTIENEKEKLSKKS